ncbi:unknown [Roseburia sp. CAG:197]|nr:unknown [Roseburia sp. CAG:197]
MNREGCWMVKASALVKVILRNTMYMHGDTEKTTIQLWGKYNRKNSGIRMFFGIKPVTQKKRIGESIDLYWQAEAMSVKWKV